MDGKRRDVGGRREIKGGGAVGYALWWLKRDDGWTGGEKHEGIIGEDQSTNQLIDRSISGSRKRRAGLTKEKKSKTRV